MRKVGQTRVLLDASFPPLKCCPSNESLITIIRGIWGFFQEFVFSRTWCRFCANLFLCSAVRCTSPTRRRSQLQTYLRALFLPQLGFVIESIVVSFHLARLASGSAQSEYDARCATRTDFDSSTTR